MRQVTFRLQMEALSPILAGGERTAGNQVQAAGHLTGTQLRGALGGKLMRLGIAKPELSFLLGKDGIAVDNAYPVGTPDGRFHPLPLSTRRSKYGGSDLPYVDTLLEPLATHPDDGSPLERVPPLYGTLQARHRVWPDREETCQARREISAHLEVDRDTGTHRPGVLFTLNALEAGTLFSSELRCTPEQARLLVRSLGLNEPDLCGPESIPAWSGGFELQVGQARSRGMGCLSVSMKLQRLRPGAPVADRLARLAGARPTGALEFTLTLLSDAIVADERLRHRPALDVPDLKRECPGLGALTASLERCVLDVRRICAWHGGAGLPRPDDLAVAMGSAFLYRCIDGADRDQLIRELEQVESSGLGCRRQEGFGRVLACAPWHVHGTVRPKGSVTA